MNATHEMVNQSTCLSPVIEDTTICGYTTRNCSDHKFMKKLSHPRGGLVLL